MTRRRTIFALSTILALTITSRADAQGCISYEGERRTISLSVSGVTVEVLIKRFEDPAFAEEDVPNCVAGTRVELSNYPTSRVAMRPPDVAESIRDAVEELGASECRVLIWYVNDTSEEVEHDDLCRVETFRFAKDAYWSSSREASCWEAL